MSGSWDIMFYYRICNIMGEAKGRQYKWDGKIAWT